MNTQIEARAGTPGALYQTKSGHQVRVLRIEAEQVILQAPGQEKEIPVPSYYVLLPVAEEAAARQPVEQLGPDGQPRMQVTVEELVMQPRAIIAPAIPRLSTPDLERLSELDTRMFVIDLIGKELRARAERDSSEPPAACAHVLNFTPAMDCWKCASCGTVLLTTEEATRMRSDEELRALLLARGVPAEHAQPLPRVSSSEQPAKPRRVWIMLLRDEMLIEVPGRRALRLPYEGEGAPRAWYGFRAASPPEGYDGPEEGAESSQDAGVRMLTDALKQAVGDDGIDPPIDGWELRSTMAQAIEEARLATCEGNTPRGLSSSRDQAAFVKDVSSLTALAWMGRGGIQPTTKREIERQVKALEGLLACATTTELAKWAEDKRSKPLDRPGVARRYAYVRAHLEAIEWAVPFLAWCQEEGFSFDLDGQEQDVGAWLDGMGEETPERIRAAGAAAKAVQERQLADRQERAAPVPASTPAKQLPPLTERIADFVGRSSLIPDWITRETFSDRCFERIAVLVGDPDSDALPLLDRTTDLKILETAAAWLTASGAWPDRLQLIREQLLDVKPSTVPAVPVKLSGASLEDQLATCSAGRALELLAGADRERDLEAITRAFKRSTNARVKTACREWLERHRPAVESAPALAAGAEEAAQLAELQARASVALGQFSTWNIDVSHQRAPLASESSWCVIARTPTGLRRAGYGETVEGAAADLRALLEQEFPSPAPPPPSPPPVEKHEEPAAVADEPIVLERVILVQLPDGREDVWYDSPSAGKVLLGESRRPDLKPIAGAARKRDAQAAILARQQDAAKMTAAAVQAAQQTLASFAVGLPAFVQLGIQVEIKITTSPTAKS